MSSSCLLADVVLPLPLADTYTYRLPECLRERAQVGCRLIVPFGTRKLYSAVIVKVHDDVPSPDFQLKEAIELLDEAPVLLPSQLWLWRWIADYYICSVGEVYKAALPSGMKLESESVVVFNPDYDDDAPLSNTEQYILDLMEHLKEQKVLELQKAVEEMKRTASHDVRRLNVLSVVKSLLDKGALVMREDLKRTYQPKTVHCVRLSDAFFSQERLDAWYEATRRAPQQQALLTRYLQEAKAQAALTMRNSSLLLDVEQSVLVKETSASALRALKEQGVLEVYEKEVSRLSGEWRVESGERIVLDLQNNTQGEKLSSLHSPLSTLHQEKPSTLHPILSEPQQRAFDAIQTSFRTHNTCLLHGVTSSGKTEIYIHLILEQLEQGRQVLYMLPEIVLTAQLVERLKRVFGDRLGVYHSKYPDVERVEVWQKQLSDAPYDIIVGVRSSVFLPFQRLGLVIIDEEHETSFKQQEPAPRYHARNVALVLAQRSGAKTLLGTATPSIESYYNAQTGKYGLVELTERYGQVKLPHIEVVNIKEERRRKNMSGPFSPQLLKAMREALEHREQIILFQNRRGYAPQMECHVCGWTPRCTNCDVSLTYHKGTGRMTCHYCGAVYPIPPRCPNCQSDELNAVGYGTERIEDDIQQHFPQARIARMDLDTTRSRRAYERIINDFQHGRTDILVGTQMVTKGLDFERVSVVGILNADTMLNMPDFRSYERAFQMMSQVAGRAGRRSAQGRVILQTKSPDLSVVSQVVTNDYASLYREQLAEREAFSYPPFSRLVYIYLKHRDARIVEALARDMAALLRRVFGHRVLGPDTPPIGRVQLLYIRKLVLKIEITASMQEARRRLREIQHYLLALPQYKTAQVYYDIDPY